ncbi:DUF3127 domain-containing protein [Phocaeicola coprocola]|uniref:DUF3127 domain-containing protein n=1 Tax=Phocaeicola coprocola TaxID=310298 RepID=UPI0039F57550
MLTILMAMLLGVMKPMQQKQPMKVIGPTLKGKIIVPIAMNMMKKQTNINQNQRKKTMNIKGKIIIVKDTESITTRDNRTILKRTAVVETDGGKYAQSIAFDVMGEDVNNQWLAVGQKVEVDYNCHVTEFNGKLYNNIRAWRIIEYKDEK